MSHTITVRKFRLFVGDYFNPPIEAEREFFDPPRPALEEACRLSKESPESVIAVWEDNGHLAVIYINGKQFFETSL